MSDAAPVTPPRRVWVAILAWFLRLLALLVILAIGLRVQAWLAAKRQPPARRVATEIERMVETVTARYGAETIALRGYGSVRLGTMLPISPQVGGRVARIMPGLEDGVTINAGTELLAIDDRDLRLAKALQEAELTRLAAEVTVLESELRQRRQFVPLREEQLGLAEKELARTQALRAAGDLATLSEVEAAQARVLNQREAVLALQTELAILPSRIAAVQAARGRSEQTIAQLELDLSRCVLTAPFTGRARAVRLELGQVLSPGQVVLELVDDSSREVAISLPAAEVTRWLRFRNGQAKDHGWFHQLDQVPTEIRWVDAADQQAWAGEISRVEAYDESTRTLQVVSRLLPLAEGVTPPYPLVAGMFCEVTVPGRTLARVVRLPRHALQPDERLFIIAGGRLAQRQVTVADRRGNEVLISDGVAEGDEVIVGKLLSPVLGMKVRSTKDGPPPPPVLPGDGVEPPATTPPAKDAPPAKAPAKAAPAATPPSPTPAAAPSH